MMLSKVALGIKQVFQMFGEYFVLKIVFEEKIFTVDRSQVFGTFCEWLFGLAAFDRDAEFFAAHEGHGVVVDLEAAVFGVVEGTCYTEEVVDAGVADPS